MYTFLYQFLLRIAIEPPFRLIVRHILKIFPLSARTRSFWEISTRPAYLLGILAAADQAAREGVTEICVIEFGVAGGNGLIAMQQEAAAVERETGIKIQIFGFDMGHEGLPSFIGDYRDHPDIWQPGDYPMNVDRLTKLLGPRTTLVLGNIADTARRFFSTHQPPPIGFISIDVDLYSSTRDALRILEDTNCKMLRHAPIYFDDIDFMFNHKFAGELLAIEEFNAKSINVKLDRWYAVANGRPFPERHFLNKLYVAHDLNASEPSRLARTAATLPLLD